MCDIISSVSNLICKDMVMLRSFFFTFLDKTLFALKWINNKTNLVFLGYKSVFVYFYYILGLLLEAF